MAELQDLKRLLSDLKRAKKNPANEARRVDSAIRCTEDAIREANR